MPVWLVWAVVGVLLAIGEILTPGLFFLGPVALAAGVAAVAAALGAGALGSTLVFVIGAIAALAVLRPVARAHIHMPVISRTGTDALVGRPAVVVRRVDDGGGRVRIGGDEWTARPFLEGHVLEEGTRVEVVKIEGATALVME